MDSLELTQPELGFYSSTMLTDKSIAIFKSQLTFAYYTTSLPYQWIPGKKKFFEGTDIVWGKLIYSKEGVNVQRWHLRLFIFGGYNVYLVLLALYLMLWGEYHWQSLSLSAKIAFFMWVVVYTSISVIGITLMLKHEEICALVNKIVGVWRDNFYNSQKRGGKLHWIMLYWIVLTPFIPPIVAMFFWISPCSPQFIYSVVMSSCRSQGGGIHGVWIKLAFYLLEVLMLSPAAAFAGIISMLMIMGLTSINSFLHHVRNLGKINRLLLNREKWHEAGLHRQARLYSQCQILVQLFNECFMSYQMPNMFVVHAICNVISLFAIIELRATVAFTEFISYPFLLALCVAFDVIIMEYANRPQSHSTAIKLQWRRRQQVGRDNWLRKFSRSCPILKIYTKPLLPVGRRTLTVFLRFCVQRSFFLAVFYRKMNKIWE